VAVIGQELKRASYFFNSVAQGLGVLKLYEKKILSGCNNNTLCLFNDGTKLMSTEKQRLRKEKLPGHSPGGKTSNLFWKNKLLQV